MSDPANTDTFSTLLTRFNLSDVPQDVALGSGIAFVATNSGLEVVNYLPFDSQGQAPNVDISTPVDIDEETEGIQALEGTTIPINTNVTDDVQVRNVELLVDGEVVSNDVSFPLDFSTIAPSITPDVNSTEIQVRATDTGGNSTLTNTDRDRDPFTLIESGTYRLIVDGGFNNVNGDFSFQLLSLDAVPTLELDTTITDTLNPIESEVSQFSATAGQRLYLDNISNSDRFGAAWRIYNQGNGVVGSDSIGDDFEVTLPTDGTYILIADSASSDPIDYSFQVVTAETQTTELTLGEAVAGTISDPGEIDRFTFAGNAGQRLVFDGLDADSDFDAELFSPSGDRLFRNDTDRDSNPITLIENGTYELIIDPSDETTGDYSFNLFDVGTETELELDTAITGVLDPGIESQVFQFTGIEGQRLYFDSLANVSGANWLLYDPANQNLFNVGLGSDREVTLPTDGDYALILDGFSPETTVNYNFQVVTAETQTTELTLGEAVAGTISDPGEIDRFTFAGNAGQRLVFDGLDADSDFDAELFSPSGDRLFRNDTDRDSNPITLIENGTYELIIDPSDETTGDYSFNLFDVGTETELELDTAITGVLDPGIESQVFQFTGIEGQRLYFDSLANVSGANWLLYDPANQNLFNRGLGQDQEITLPSDGEYALILNGATANATINYNFEVIAPSSVSTELTLGEAVSGEISQPGEEDIFTFTGSAGQRLYFDGLSSDSTFDVELFSPSGDRMFNIDTDRDSAPFSLIESGTYEVVINPFGGTTGGYNFNLLDIETSPELTFNTPLSGTLDPGLETQIFQFNGIAGQELTFDSLASGSNGRWELYGPANQTISFSNFLNRDFSVELPGDGLYSLVLQGLASSGTINYQFQVSPSEETETLSLNASTLTVSQTVSAVSSESNSLADLPSKDDAITGTEDYLFGTTGNDTLLAQGNQRLFGGAGDDSLITSDEGDNIFYGGSGADLFWLIHGTLPEQANRIVDFELGTDTLGINHDGEIDSFSDLTLEGQNQTTTVLSGDRAIATLNGISASDLSEDDFLFN